MTTTVRREDVARAVSTAVRAVPGVVGLDAGAEVEVATYFAGGKVLGLRMAGETVEVHIVADRVPLGPIANAAAEAARNALVAGGDQRDVRIVVADVLTSAIDRRRWK